MDATAAQLKKAEPKQNRRRTTVDTLPLDQLLSGPDDLIVTPPEAAIVLRSNVRTMERQRTDGSGPPFIKLGGRVRYFFGDLRRHAAQQRRDNTSQDKRDHTGVVTTRRSRVPVMKYQAQFDGAVLRPFVSKTDAAHARRVEEEVERQRVQRDARRTLDAEERRRVDPPDILTLRELIARPDPVVEWRIEGWQPAGGRVLLAAMAKTGKTTLMNALVRSLVDGQPFLGRHRVEPVAGTVAILDTEMSSMQIRRWLQEVRISSDDRMIVAPLRGHVDALNLLDRDIFAKWVSWLRSGSVTYLILDCLRPVLDALGLDEHRDAGRFLVAFDALLREASIAEGVVVHHMGHSGERSRGDSRLRDWPDVEWRMVRQGEDQASPRYIAAYGRDVNIPESRLAFDPATRQLTIGDGSRRDAVIRAALEDVIAALTHAYEERVDGQEWRMSLRNLEDVGKERGHARSAIRAAVSSGLRKQLIVVEKGAKRASYHRLPSQCASAPECATSAPEHSERDSAPVRHPPIGRGAEHTREHSGTSTR